MDYKYKHKDENTNAYTLNIVVCHVFIHLIFLLHVFVKHLYFIIYFIIT